MFIQPHIEQHEQGMTTKDNMKSKRTHRGSCQTAIHNVLFETLSPLQTKSVPEAAYFSTHSPDQTPRSDYFP